MAARVSADVATRAAHHMKGEQKWPPKALGGTVGLTLSVGIGIMTGPPRGEKIRYGRNSSGSI